MNLPLSALTLCAVFLGGQAGEVRVPSPGVVPEAEALIAELGCLNCHSGDAEQTVRFRPKRAPNLDQVGARRSIQWLRDYLEAPHELRPGTSMPDMLAYRPRDTRAGELERLVHHLVSSGGPLDHTPFQATDEMFEAGRQTFHQVGCVACHGPEESLAALAEPFDLAQSVRGPATNPTEEDRYIPDGTLDPPQVPLEGLGQSTTVTELAKFLQDPLSVRPSGRMPNMKLTEREAQDIAVYLLRRQALGKAYSAAPGLRYAYYEVEFPDGVPNFEGLVPQRTGVLVGEFEALNDMQGLEELTHREEHFAFVFTGNLLVEEPGMYRFRTESDDGSSLSVNGEPVVDNGGFHAVVSKDGEIELATGTHSIQITYFEATGGNELRVHWTVPGGEERPLRGDDLVHQSLAMEPLHTNAWTPAMGRRDARGALTFQELGCASCHTAPTQNAPALSACDPNSPTGCLGSQGAPGTPSYGWSAAQREAVRALLAQRNELVPQTAAERAQSVMASQQCFACHRRDGLGGPHPDRGDYFAAKPGVDLGEEGRLPPLLDAAGSKLHRSWLQQVLQEGATARPGLLTRMPQFDGAVMGELEQALVEADALVSAPVPADSTLEAVAAGRRLVGTAGFGCIQCHEFNGYPSLGINAVDLGDVTERIQYPWFRKLLEDPVALGMNSRMPLFWIDGKSPLPDVLGGDPIAQIDGIWNYLAMGDAMQLPEGLNVADSAYEVEIGPGDPPKLVGVFMKGLSPRVVAVGTSELVHYAFDVENSRLAMAWRGRFFNARGTWEGRAGLLELPPTQEVFEFPAGDPFALLASPDDKWPRTEDRAPHLKTRGRSFDRRRRPTFRYSLGQIDIEETPVSVSTPEGGFLIRRFLLKAPQPFDQLYYQSTTGRQLVSFRHVRGGGCEAAFEERIQW